jgi:pyocin large subunit-like protein
VPLTKGFRDDVERGDHFDKHGREFGVLDPVEYESMADIFLGGAKPSSTLECRRTSNGDLIRYDPLRNWFGVLGSDNSIRTFFMPVQSKHRKPTHLKYFHAECLK